MKKLFQLKERAKKQKRLHVELLESRTVLSATNLFATAIELVPTGDERFESPERPAFVAPAFASPHVASHLIPAIRIEQSPLRFSANLDSAISHGMQNEHLEVLVERFELQSSSPSRPGVPFGILPPAASELFPNNSLSDTLLSARPITSLAIDSSQVGQRHAPHTDLVSILPPPISTSLGTASIALRGAMIRSELAEQRASDPTAERFEQSLVSVADRRTEFLAERVANDGFIDNNSRPQFFDVSRDRFFTPLNDSFRIELLDRMPAVRAQSLHQFQSANAARASAPTLSSIASLTTAFSAVTHGESEQSTDGFVELSSNPQSISPLSATQQLKHTNNSEMYGSSTLRQQVTIDRITGEWRDPALSTFAESLADLAFTTQQRRFESGLFDLHVDGEQPLVSVVGANKRGLLPENNAWWNGPGRQAHESFWLEFGKSVESQLPTNVDGLTIEDGTEKPDIVSSTGESDVSEGGMVELIAASFPSDFKQEMKATESVAARSQPREAGDVQIDTGVGMFHAFELATVPHESESGQPASEIDLPAESTAAIGAGGTPTLEQAASVSDEVDAVPVRAASIPALLVAASLLFDRKRQAPGRSTETQSNIDY